MRRCVSTLASLGIGLLGIAGPGTAAGTPVVRVSSWTGALTAGAMEQFFRQNGLYETHPGRRRYRVVRIGCTGRGRPAGTDFDSAVGALKPTYRQFRCPVTIASGDYVIQVALNSGGLVWGSISSRAGKGNG